MIICTNSFIRQVLKSNSDNYAVSLLSRNDLTSLYFLKLYQVKLVLSADTSETVFFCIPKTKQED